MKMNKKRIFYSIWICNKTNSQLVTVSSHDENESQYVKSKKVNDFKSLEILSKVTNKDAKGVKLV